METDYVIGLDVGTSGTKALAFSCSGKLLDSRKTEYQAMQTAVDRMEHDAVAVSQNALNCLNELTLAMGHAPLAVGIDTFMHSLMPVDDEIKPMGNLMLWNDFRSASYAADLKETRLGKDIYRQTGTPVHPMSWLTKLRWMKDHEPDAFKKARYFIGIKEYLLYRLTGELVVDYSTASSTGLFNGSEKEWDVKALDWIGIWPERLPQPVNPSIFLSSDVLDCGKEITIISGLSDGCAANLGAASMSPAELTLTLGTSGAVRYTGTELRADPEGILFSYCLDDRLFVTGGASNNCYNVIEKVAREQRMELWKSDRESFRSSPAAEKDLFFLPWMFGERSPVQLYHPLHGYIGRTDVHTPGQLIQSSIEGILFNLKHIADKLQQINEFQFSCLHLSGGLSDLPGIRELTAAIIGLPVIMHNSSECSALGTAYFTAKQLGIVSGYDEIHTWNPVVEEVLPDETLSKNYRNAYERFLVLARDHIEKQS